MIDFKAENLKYLSDMEFRLLNIKCGFNLIKKYRINSYIKAINVVKESIRTFPRDIPCLADRWFIDSLYSVVLDFEK